MRYRVVFGVLLLGACQSSSPASPPTTVADIPVLRPEPTKEPTFAVEAPVGQPTALINARIKAMHHRIAACLNDAVNRDPLLSGKSEATFAWAAGEILRDREFDGVLSGHEAGACVTDMLEQSASNLITAGGDGAFEERDFQFTLRINFAGPYTSGHPLPPEEQRGEERWSILTESDDGSLTLNAAAPTEVSREALMRCRIPQRTSPGSDGGWLVGRIDRAGKLILPSTDSLQPSDDTPCLRRVLSRATFSPGPVRYFKVQTYPNEALGLTLHDAFVEEMARLDAQAVAQAAASSKPNSGKAEEFGMLGLLNGDPTFEKPQDDQARRLAADSEAMQMALLGASGNIGALSGGFGASGVALGNAAQGGLGSLGGEGIGLGSVGGGGTTGWGSMGTGTGFGIGGVGARPRPKMSSSFEVTGGLPKEVVQRIVRQHFGRFRFCYEKELAGHPTLAFTSETRIAINKEGGVASSTSKLSNFVGPDRPTAQFTECLHKSLRALSFPVPDKGTATAMMTLKFSPPDAENTDTSAAPSPPRRKGFDGRPLAELKLSQAFAESAPLAEGSRLTGLWFLKGSVEEDSPIVALLRGPESQAQTQAQTDCHVRDSGIELRFFARDPANAASACKDFAAKHVRPID